MTQQNTPTVNSWYKLPNADTFRVTAFDLDADYVEIQFTDGTFEDINLDTWQKLAVEKTTTSEQSLKTSKTHVNEFDFYELGGAPGAEAFVFSESI